MGGDLFSHDSWLSAQTSHNIDPVSGVDRMQLSSVPRSVPVTRLLLVTLMTGCHDNVTKVRGCRDVTNQTDTCDVCSCDTGVTTLHPLVTSANTNMMILLSLFLP